MSDNIHQHISLSVNRSNSDTQDKKNFDVCCICLDYPNEYNDIIKLSCCNIVIDKYCFLLLLINNFYNCPLCRKNKYPINKTLLLNWYEQLDTIQQNEINHKLQIYLYNMTFKSQFIRIFNVFFKFLIKCLIKSIFISFIFCCMYIFFYILLITTTTISN